MKIAILEDDDMKALVANNAIEAVFPSACSSIKRFETLCELEQCHEKFNVLVSDLNLPDSPGSSTAEFLKKQCKTLADFIVIFSTDANLSEAISQTDLTQFSYWTAADNLAGLLSNLPIMSDRWSA